MRLVGIDELKSRFREGLVAYIDTLETAKQTLHDPNPDAVESIRRIARSLCHSGKTYGFSEIVTAAEVLEQAGLRDLPAQCETLLTILHKITTSVTSDDKVKILVIEDDPAIVDLLLAVLESANREILVARTAAQGEAILTEHEVSLVLLDLILPDTDGRNLLVRLRARPATAALPIIVLSARGGAWQKTECFALGADVYFEKPFDPEMLAVAVAARLQRAVDISREARQDTLTGLPNRAAFCEAYERAVALSSRTRQPLCVAILDFDHFKRINDTYGHTTGDDVLRRVATVIADALRESDILARWGGEEFVVLCPNTDAQGAMRGLERALQAVRQTAFETADGDLFQVTFSAGVAEVSMRQSVEEAVARADGFLYCAKASGRNRIFTADTALTPTKETVLLAEDDPVSARLIRHHLEREGFEVHHCQDGGAALALAQNLTVSLAILDVMMPTMDGFTLLAHLRRLPAFAQIPIIMLTSLGCEQNLVRGFEGGADDYIVKPFSPVELMARVRRLLKKR